MVRCVEIMPGIIWEFLGGGDLRIFLEYFLSATTATNNFVLHLMGMSRSTSTTVYSLWSAVEVDSHLSIVTLHMPHLPFQ